VTARRGSSPRRSAHSGRPDADVTLYIGGVYASPLPAVVKTLLGSCVAVCFYDPVARVGGMNHFMLPRGSGGDGDLSTRFGVHAMDSLIGATMKAGGDRRRFVAKVFGGAHVLAVAETPGGVPRQNIDFVQDFLEAEGFPMLASDVGGYWPRQIVFHTATGRAFVKRVLGARARARLVSAEGANTRKPTYGDVTLFE
jgi:chemotaxis receptor (MCP) glutamine deamidase CheD